MNWKSFTAIALATAGFGLAIHSSSVQAEQNAPNPLEARIAAIEKYLHLDDVQKNQSVVTDAKSFDDLKAAMIKLDTEQDALARRIRTASQSNSTIESSKDLDEIKRSVDGLVTQMRSVEERLRKAEQKLR